MDASQRPDALAGEDGCWSDCQIGTTVFFPGRGLGVVVDRATCAPLGIPREYLTISIEAAGLTVKVPVDQATHVGLRTPANRVELRAALEMLADDVGDEPSWQARIKANRLKLIDGSSGCAAEVLRDLSRRANHRPLGMQERDQHRQAIEILQGQIMYAFEIDQPRALIVLNKSLPAPEPAVG
jgi:CarD family transcriptional regulator